MKKIFTLLLALGVLTTYAQNFDWTAQESGTDVRLIDVFFTDTLNGWAVGSEGTIISTENGGETWMEQTSGTDQELKAIHFINSDTGWVAGGSSGLTLLTTVDGGTTWLDTTPDISATSSLFDVFFADNNHGWTISLSNIYSTTDGGATWVMEEFSSSIHSGIVVHAITATSDSTAFASGKMNTSNTVSRGAVFDNSTNSEGFWTPDGANEFVKDDIIREIDFGDYNTGFASGQMGRIYKMEFNGTNYNGPWELNFSTGREDFISSISFPSASHGMFNTAIDGSSGNIVLIYHTEDGGDSWSTQPDSIHGLLLGRLFAVNDTNAWIVGNAGAIFKGTAVDNGPPTIVQNAQLLPFNISPNPFYDQLRIQLPDSYENIQIHISGISGQVYKVLNLDGGQNQFRLSNLEDLPGGIYFIHVTSNNQALFETQKLIKL